MDIQGIVFDLDGTLVDTEELHLKAWSDSVGKYGHELPEGWKHMYVGNPDIDMARFCARTYSPIPPPEALMEERHLRYRELLRSHGEKSAFPGVRDELVELGRAGFKMSVGTNSPIENALDALVHAGIREFFPVVVAYGMTERGKPAPDIFLAACDGMGLRPEKCVVIEDSGPGVEAGKRAGCLVLGLTTTFPRESVGSADHVFADTLSALRWIRGNRRAGR